MKYETTNFIKKITKSHPVLNLDIIVYFQFNDRHNHNLRGNGDMLYRTHPPNPF